MIRALHDKINIYEAYLKGIQGNPSSVNFYSSHRFLLHAEKTFASSLIPASLLIAAYLK